MRYYNSFLSQSLVIPYMIHDKYHTLASNLLIGISIKYYTNISQVSAILNQSISIIKYVFAWYISNIISFVLAHVTFYSATQPLASIYYHVPSTALILTI